MKEVKKHIQSYIYQGIFREFDPMHYLKKLDMGKIVSLFLLSLILLILLILLIVPFTQAASSFQDSLSGKKYVVKEEHLIFPFPKVDSIGINKCIVSLQIDNMLNQTVVVKVVPRYPSEAIMIKYPDSNITINPMQGKSITYSLRFPKAGNYNLFGDTLEVYSTDGTFIKRIVTNDCQISIEYWNLPWCAFLISVISQLFIISALLLIIGFVAVKISHTAKKFNIDFSKELIFWGIFITLIVISIIYNLKIFMG
jgi:fumarate reductase subunit D